MDGASEEVVAELVAGAAFGFGGVSVFSNKRERIANLGYHADYESLLFDVVRPYGVHVF